MAVKSEYDLLKDKVNKLEKQMVTLCKQVELQKRTIHLLTQKLNRSRFINETKTKETKTK